MIVEPSRPPRSREEISQLVRANLGIAHYVANRATRRDDDDRPDLVQVAVLAMLSAAERWNPELGSFAAYAFSYAAPAVRRHRRRARSVVVASERAGMRPLDASLDAPIGHGTSARVPIDELESDAPGPSELAEHSELVESVRQTVAKLPESERATIEALYFADESATLTSAGRALGITCESMRIRQRKALESMRRALSRR